MQGSPRGGRQRRRWSLCTVPWCTLEQLGWGWRGSQTAPGGGLCRCCELGPRHQERAPSLTLARPLPAEPARGCPVGAGEGWLSRSLWEPINKLPPPDPDPQPPASRRFTGGTASTPPVPRACTATWWSHWEGLRTPCPFLPPLRQVGSIHPQVWGAPTCGWEPTPCVPLGHPAAPLAWGFKDQCLTDPLPSTPPPSTPGHFPLVPVLVLPGEPPTPVGALGVRAALQAAWGRG